MQILWHTDTAANGRNQQYENQISFRHRVFWFGTKYQQQWSFYLHPLPISTLVLKWPPHITIINTRKPHLGEKKQAQIKTVTTVVIKIKIQNILCITKIQICQGWIPRCNNIGLYTIHIKHTQEPSGVQFYMRFSIVSPRLLSLQPFVSINALLLIVLLLTSITVICCSINKMN